MKKILFIICLAIYPIVSWSESNTTLEIHLLTPDVIGEVVLDKDPSIKWIKKISDELENYLKSTNGNRDVLVSISLHKDREATIDIGARPKFDDNSIDELKKQIDKFKPSPRTKITDYNLAIYSKINSGCSKEMDFSPHIDNPLDKVFIRYKKLSLSEKKNYIQKWMREEIIPILAHYETTVDKKFQGVLSVGETLTSGAYLDSDIEQVTTHNSNYWRAVMEMSLGNQLIPFSKVSMHIAKGEFDKANRLLFVINNFSDKSSISAVLYPILGRKLKILKDSLNIEIQKGIAMHDKGEYKNALSHYENLLKIFPYSAWLNYEYFYSKTINIDNREKEWEKAKKIIYSSDPMYHIEIKAQNAKEGYLLFKRYEISSLFNKKENFKKDFVKYAEIAFDLKDYGFAGELYWLILNYFPKEVYGDKDILAYYLYCLDKLGDKESIKNFDGDFAKRFKYIDKNRDERFKNSKEYNMFKVKGEL